MQDGPVQKLYEILYQCPDPAATLDAALLGNEEAIPLLLSAIQFTRVIATQRVAAALIRVLAEVPKARHRIVFSANAIPVLIQLTKSSSYVLAVEAQGALQNLACDGPLIQEEMIQCGGMHVIIRQLQSHQEELRTCAAAALTQLCQHPRIAHAAIEERLLPDLHHIATNGPADLRNKAALILYHMSRHAVCHPSLVAESLSTIITLLSQEATDQYSPSLCALIELASSSGSYCKDIVMAGGMQALLDSWVSCLQPDGCNDPEHGVHLP